jgi:hypothetical protein
MRSRVLVVSLILLSSMCMMGSDSCKGVVKVKIPPATFEKSSDPSGAWVLDAAMPGQGFTWSIPYSGGKAPFACSLKAVDAQTPLASWMTVESQTPGFCTIHGTVPSDAQDGAQFPFELDLTDGTGVTAKLIVGSPSAGSK